MSWIRIILMLVIRMPAIVRAFNDIRNELDAKEFNERIDLLLKSKGGSESAQAMRNLFNRKL